MEREERKRKLKKEQEKQGAKRVAPTAANEHRTQNYGHLRTKVPQGWLDCPAFGQCIDKLIPSKVPLDETYNEIVPHGKRYSCKQLLDKQTKAGHQIGLILDLTNTTMYYSVQAWTKLGIKHQKIACRGGDALPDNESVNQFVCAVTEFINCHKNSQDQKYVVVHCIHGHNQTGFMIVHYLMRSHLISVTEALHKFAVSRPPGIYKPEYIQALYKFYHEVSESFVCPSTPEWKRCLDLDMNGDPVHDEDDHLSNSISALPDDILLKILSFLDSKTAISTSILSRRWRPLFHSLCWFDLTLTIPSFFEHDQRARQFIETVQSLLDPNTTPQIRSLFIELIYLQENHWHSLKDCIINSFGSNLQIFGLSYLDKYFDRLIFPLDSLDGLGNSIEILFLLGCILMPFCGYSAFKSVKELFLTSVTIYEKEETELDGTIDDGFHLMINGLVNLERLSLNGCMVYSVARIDAPFSLIKEMKFHVCKTDRIEIICAPRLESLDIYNSPFPDVTEPIQTLKYLRMGFNYDGPFGPPNYRPTLGDVSSLAPCIETLVLCFEGSQVWLDQEHCSASFMKLKHLVIEARMPKICDPFWIGLILEAAPLLETFQIKIEKEIFPSFEQPLEQIEPPPAFEHKNLKEIIMVGFDECPIDMKLTRYLQGVAIVNLQGVQNVKLHSTSIDDLQNIYTS